MQEGAEDRKAFGGDVGGVDGVDGVTQVQVDEVSPDYVMFALTFLVIAYSIYRFVQARRAAAAVGGRVGTRLTTSTRPQQGNGRTSRVPRPNNKYYNGGIGSGGSGTMVQAPPDASPSEHQGNSDAVASNTDRAPNDTRKVSALIGPELLTSTGGTIATSVALRTPRLVALYFSAHWCPPCKAFTPKLVKFYNSLRRRGNAPIEIIFVSSDRSADKFKQYFSSMPWLAVPFENGALRKKLGEHVSIRSIPTLAFISPITGKVLSVDGRSMVQNDPSGAKFPWGIVDPDGSRNTFQGSGRSLVSSSTLQAQDLTALSRKQRAALIAEQYNARRKKARAQAKAASSPRSPNADIATAASQSKNVTVSPSAKVTRQSTIISAIEIDEDAKDCALALVNDEDDTASLVTPVQLIQIAQKAFAKNGTATPSPTITFKFGSVKVELQIRTISEKEQLSLKIEGSDALHTVDTSLKEPGLVLHLSKRSICLGPVCIPLSVESTAASNSQQGEKEPVTIGKIRPGRKTGGKSMATPAWLRGEMEAPAALQTENGFTRSVFSPEQQERLGVDENGQPVKSKSKSSSKQANATSLHSSEQPAIRVTDANTHENKQKATNVGNSVDDESTPVQHSVWQVAPALTSQDFLHPQNKEDDVSASSRSDGYECPVGVRHILQGMPEMTQYIRDAEAHGLAVMVDYFATWCGPCRAIKPFYEELAARFSGRMVFLSVDCGGRDANAINQDVRRLVNISAFPTFHVYSGGEKVAEVRGGNSGELLRLAEQYATSAIESGGSKGKDKRARIRSAYSVCLEEFDTKNLTVVGNGLPVPSASAKSLSTAKSKKVMAKLRDLMDRNIYPFEEALDMDAIESLVNGCLTQSLYWHTSGTSLKIKNHAEGVGELTRALSHTVAPGARPWWQLDHVFPLLDLAEAVLQHPEGQIIGERTSKGAPCLYSAIVRTAERFCARPDVSEWIASGVGRATCERLLSCLTIIAAPPKLQSDKLGDDVGNTSNDFPWLGVAANGDILVDLAANFVKVLSNAAGVGEEATRVKSFERLLRDAARFLFNTSVVLLRTPLRFKRSADATATNITRVIDSSVEVLLQLQILTASDTKLSAPVIDGQIFALRAACTCLVQSNGVYPVHPESVRRKLRTASGLPAKVALDVWANARNKILQKAMTAMRKSTNHLFKEAEEESKQKENSDETTSQSEAQRKPKSLPALLKQASREAVLLINETPRHPGQTTSPFPNPWTKA